MLPGLLRSYITHHVIPTWWGNGVLSDGKTMPLFYDVLITFGDANRKAETDPGKL